MTAVRSSWLRLSLVVFLGCVLATSLLIRPVASQQRSPVAATAQRPPGAEYSGRAFTFNPIAEGVYLAVASGSLSVICNAGIIVNANDVLVVDSHISPAAAWALREELKTITDNPIRYVLNSHFHVDHAHGNQIYGRDVEIIGHDFTRERLLAGDSMRGAAYESLIGGLPAQIVDLQKRIAGASGEERAGLERQLAVARNAEIAAQTVKPTPPSTTFPLAMTLHRGGREIRLLFLGRGHTGGDVVVHLPRERIVFTGDLLLNGLSYMGDSYPMEWADTLEKLKRLEFDVILPAHGMPFRDKTRIEYFQAYLRDFWAQAQKLHAARVPLDAAVTRFDLSAHAARYAGNVTPPISMRSAVARAYLLLDEASRAQRVRQLAKP